MTYGFRFLHTKGAKTDAFCYGESGVNTRGRHSGFLRPKVSKISQGIPKEVATVRTTSEKVSQKTFFNLSTCKGAFCGADCVRRGG